MLTRRERPWGRSSLVRCGRARQRSCREGRGPTEASARRQRRGAARTVPVVQPVIGKARHDRQHRFAFLHRRPQRAGGALRLANSPRSCVFLAARRPRQSAQAHNLRLAQMQQGSGQILIHSRQRLARAKRASANSSVRRRSARASSSSRSRWGRQADSGSSSTARFSSGLLSRRRVLFFRITPAPAP